MDESSVQVKILTADTTDYDRPRRPIGSQGSFFAKYAGESLPCVFERWRDGDRYRDPGVKPSSKKWLNYFAAMRDGRKVILTRQKELENGTFRRKGYVGIYEIADCHMSDDRLEFTFVKMTEDFSER